MTLNNRLPIAITRYLVRTTLQRAAFLVMAVGLLPQASFAHSTSCGSATTTDQSFFNDVWWALRACTLNLTDGPHKCVVTACGDYENPFYPGISQVRYRFKVTADGSPSGTDSAYERAVELPNNGAVNDPDSAAVCTVAYFSLSAGNHQFNSWTKIFDTDTPGGKVRDSSLGVVCTDDN